SPLILCVQISILHFPHDKWRSGLWPSASATAPTLFTKAKACAKSLKVYSRSRWPSWLKDHPRPSSFNNACARSLGRGGTPPRQGIHLLSARPITASRFSNDSLLYGGFYDRNKAGSATRTRPARLPIWQDRPF